MSLISRLDAKLDKSGGPDACWPFKGAQSRGSGRETTYGNLQEGGRGSRNWRVNRLVLLLEEIPLEICDSEEELLRWLGVADRQRGDQDAAHSCDHGPCGNPGHLAWESHRMNVQEQAARKREAKRAREEAA
jgi:hypothetical protein